MNILLCIPYMLFDDTKYLSSSDSAFPMGTGYVASALRNAGHNILIFDFQLPDNTIDKFRKQLKEENFEVIGFSVTTATKNSVFNLSNICKEILPDCFVITGGAYPTIYPKKILTDCPSVDFEVVGEGEITIIELLAALETGSNLSDVQGIVYRKKDGSVESTPLRPLIEDLDSLPFPAFDLFDLNAYNPPPGMFFKKPMRHIISTRGCPFNCIFCDDRIIWRGRCRLRSAENIYSEMELLVKKYGANEIHFYDDTFTVNKKRVFQLCDLIKSNKLKVIWRCSSRVDTITPEMLKAMYSAGCRSISYGIESGDNEILKKMNKGTTIEQAKNAVKWTNKARIQAKGFFMMNFPGETIETTEKTISLSKELDLDFAGFNLTIPHHGKKLKKIIEDNYELNEEVYYDDNARLGNEIYFYQPSLPADYLKKAYKRAAREFYFRPKYMIRMITRIRNLSMLLSYLKGFSRLFKIKI